LADNVFLRLSAFSKLRGGHVGIVDFACAEPELGADVPVRSTPDDCSLGRLGASRHRASAPRCGSCPPPGGGEHHPIFDR